MSVQAVYERLKELRRQVYGENYPYDVWREIEEMLKEIASS